ncbi:MAG: hypothetical protein NVV83_10495 [Afipia sp.]|nr:hypothetical protein [Afipia sp.]
MTDEELLNQAPHLPTMYFDGFGAYRKVNGVLRCIGYVLHGGPNLNLIISLAGADMAQLETRRVLSEEPTKAIHIWDGTELAH